MSLFVRFVEHAPITHHYACAVEKVTLLSTVARSFVMAKQRALSELSLPHVMCTMNELVL